uniref:Nuclease n=1 Tax=Podoviridae sp. ct6BA50 TaxID=2825221 RepID=A0A8S5VG55_9CAUD|nr:MAG TPA: nuclease [Podoviridae sp. ct6BA50]
MGRLVKIDNRTDNNINSNEKKGRLVRVSDTPELELGYMIRDAKKRETPVPQPSRTTNNTARQQPRANSFVQGNGMSKLQQMEAQREERQQKTQNPARSAKAAQIVREAEARSPRARSAQKADTGTLNDRGSVQRARNGYELGGKRSQDTRASKAVQSIGLNTIGSAEMLGEGLKQANENVDILAGDQIYSQLQGQYEQMGRQLNGAVQRYGMDSPEAESIRQSMNEVRERLTARRGQIEKTIDTNSHAYRTAQMGQEAASQALEGLSGVGGFLGETALSIADNASLMPLAAINPALPLVIMSIKAAGSRAKELTDQGTAAGEALSRGVVSGIIEGLSENVSLGSFLEMVNTGGRGWLLNLLKQAGVEGAEEITSYIANYAMDKAAQDPNAQFDAGEMLRQGASGALSGLVFGGVGTAVNRLNGYRGADYSQVDSIQGDGAPSAIERSVQNVRQTLGAEGQSTFDQMRTEGQDPSAAVDYTERFVDAYNKGRRNEGIPQAAEMTDAEAETRAAWNAGRVDALTQEGARNKQNQATREAGAGIIRTEYTDSLDQKTVSALDRAAKQLGVTVEFADEVAGGNANAEIQGNRITIEKWNRNPVRALFGHEITHRIQELSADSYAEYKAAAREAMGADFDRLVGDYQRDALENGFEYSRAQAEDEVVADFAGDLLQKDGTLERFIQSAQSKPTLLQRIAQVFRNLVNKLRGTEKAQAERALGKLEKAYAAAAQAEKSGGDGTRYSIKRTSQMTLEQQLRDYYAGKLKSSDSLYFGATPDTLRSAGLDALPLAFGTADFRKSVKEKHNVPRRAIKKTQDNLQNALFAFSDGSRIGFVVPDIDADGKPLLIGIEKGVQMDAEMVNSIRSMYGLDHPAEWIQNQIESGKTAIVLDEEKANTFLYPYGYKASRKEGIRSMNPNIPFSKENVKRFSLKKPVEETDKLLALHNKDENSILTALDLGGLPMPSIAVVKARDGHSKYGPISLVFNKDTIDPQRSSANKVYGGDAWTPTAPRVDYPVNSKKALQLEQELHRLAGDVSVAGGIFGNSAALRSMGIDDTSTRNTTELAEKLASTDTVRAAYLADQGKTLEPVKMDKVWDRFGNDTLQKVVDRLGVDTLAEMEANLEMGESVEDALGVNAEDLRDILRDYYREKGEPMLRRMAVKRGWTNAEINEKRQARIDKSMEDVSIFALEDIVHHAWDMYQDGGATKGEIDRMATSDALRNAVDDHAVEVWIAGKLDGLLGEAGIYNGKDPFTPSGDSRSFSQLHYAYTLENIVKAMKEGQEERGGNTWGASAKTLQSVATPEYRSIQEIKADSGRLGVTEGTEYEAKLQAIDDQIGSIITKVKQGNSSHSDNPFTESDIIGGILIDTANGKKTVDAIVKAFSKAGYKIGNQTALDIQSVYKTAAEMPTGYFEAKPQRAVGFDEVLAAVIPSDSSQKLRDALGEAGVRTLEYKAGDEADRLAKVNSVENAQFSRKTTSALFNAYKDINQRLRAGEITQEQATQEKATALDRIYTGYVQSYGEMAPGENPARKVSVPKQTSDTTKVSQTIRTIMEAKATPESILPTLKESIASGDFDYETYTDAAAKADAEKTIRDVGWDKAQRKWFNAMENGIVTKENTALGWTLYNNAVNSGNTELAIDVLNQMVKSQRNAAQALQATRILKQLSPEGQLYQVQRSVADLQREINNRYRKDGAPKLEIDKDLAKKLMEAKDQNSRDKVLEEIYKDIGRQMPSRFIDKWNAWRYLAMLGNPRTHVRNIVGNAGFMPVVGVKNLTAQVIESAASKFSPGMERTKGTFSAKLFKAALADYANVEGAAMSGGKYSDFAAANKYVEEGRQIFGTSRWKFWNKTAGRALETLRKKNGAALDAEDVWFSKPHYANAMAQYCKANGITAEQIRSGDEKVLRKARAYAVQEAAKATYRDTNALSEAVSSIGGRWRSSDNKVKRVTGTLVEGILPFRKTPANILARGLEYSPAGLLKGLTNDLVQVKKGNMTAAQAIDNISAGLTGTGLLMLGGYMAAEGLLGAFLRGGGSGDDDKDKMDDLAGRQDYSLEVGDTSVTLDWLAPEALPLFVGVNLYETWKANNGEMQLSDYLNAIKNVSEPMVEMSCLQSLDDVFNSVATARYSGKSALTAVLVSAATSYITQLLPTIVGQAERTSEPLRMTTYTSKGKFATTDVQYFLGKSSARFPVWDYQQIPYIDAWGRTESNGTTAERAFNNFVNPAYVSTVRQSDMEKEIERLYEATEDGGVVPDRADKSIKLQEGTKYLSPQEYVTYAQEKGQKSYALAEELVNSAAYQAADDTRKADMIRYAYQYATAVAKTKVSDYALRGWQAKCAEVTKKTGLSEATYITLYLEQLDVEGYKDEDGDPIANSAGLQKMEVVYNMPGLTDAQRSALFGAFGVGKKVAHYNKAKVSQELGKLRSKAR